MLTNVKTKDVLGYLFLPRLGPRLYDVVFSGFAHVALFMAYIYRMVGLLPAGHPYLNGANIGRFGIRHVIAEAASHLQFKKEHIDQIIIFVVLMAGIVVLFFQLGLLGVSLFMQVAHAAPAMPTTFEGFFRTWDPEDDLAFILLDRVFGVEGIFGSCVELGECTYAGTYDYNGSGQADGFLPFHAAMHEMLGFYSAGLLVVATIILAYFIFAVLAETAESGTPFGKRFNHLWAPVRLVAAFGLLIPLGGHGLNSAQYITLYAAKWGSGFATNGWIYFLNGAGLLGTGADPNNTILGDAESLVVTPKTPEVNALAEFFTIAQACAYADKMKIGGEPVKPYLVKGTAVAGGTSFVKEVTGGVSYKNALDFYDNQDIIIRFGKYDPEPDEAKNKYAAYNGHVEPTCGEIRMTTTVADRVYPGVGGATCYAGQESAAACAQRIYFEMLYDMWADPDLEHWGCAYAATYADYKRKKGDTPGKLISEFCPGPFAADHVGLPTSEDLMGDAGLGYYNEQIDLAVKSSTALQRTDSSWVGAMGDLGWAGAGIWYNKLAQVNGDLMGAVYDLPYIQRYPMVMQEIFDKGMKKNANMTADWYTLVVSRGELIKLGKNSDSSVARALFEAKRAWANIVASPTGGGIFTQIIKTLFGLDGLYAMTDSVDVNGNPIQIHPLVQLTGLGRSLIESGVRNMAFAGMAYGGGALAILGDADKLGKGAMGVGQFFMTVATMGLSMGFVLFYVIPFMPFLFFYFAVGKWVKGIFEAMVGVPLWALAHIRIDGNGLPGDAARGGYWLIFEIFLRPILIVFGLLAGIIVFSAQVRVLHEIWELVTTNIAGYDASSIAAAGTGDLTNGSFYRGAVDQFFYTVIYTIIVYMLANASFKLVDLIPNQMLRWMGESVPTFGEQAAEDTNIMRNAFMASGNIMSQIGQGMKSSGEGVGALAKSASGKEKT